MKQNEKPILFSGEMVRAILDGHKTMTRRVVKHPDANIGYGVEDLEDGTFCFLVAGDMGYGEPIKSPYQAGQRLWVRDWACRLELVVTAVRVERLKDISEGDCWDEGIEEWLKNDKNLPRWADGGITKYTSVRHAFKALWDSINAKRGYGWDANPWVWVVEFEKV